MKRIIALISMLVASGVFAQHTTINSIQQEDADNDEARSEWIRSMHRAAPGVNWQQMDAATRDAKYRAFLESRRKHSRAVPLSIPQDTIAGGHLLGYWTERGSSNICGRIHTADIDFTNENIYAASAMGDIWKTALLNPAQWTILNDQHRFGEVRMLRIITTPTGQRIIAMANQPASVYFPDVPANVYYSDDDGTTWQTATGLSAPNAAGGFKRGVMSSDESTIYVLANEWNAGTSSYWTSVYKSANQGKTFTNLGKWNYNVGLCDIWTSRDYASNFYFLKGDSLFRLSGNSFVFVHKMTYSTGIGSVGGLLLQGTITASFSTLDIAETTNSVTTIYLSTNNGTSWNKSGTFSGSPFNTNSFKTMPNSPTVMAIGNNNPYVSRNGGSTWTLINDWSEYYGDSATKLHADIDGIDLLQGPSGEEYQLFSTDGGLFLSSDVMNTFTNITQSSIGTSQYYSTFTSTSSPNYIFSGSQDQGFQVVQDNSGVLKMYQTLSGDYGHVSSSDNGSSIWTVYPGTAHYYPNAKTSGYNKTWSFIGSNYLWMPPLVADPGDPQSAYIASGGNLSQSYLWHLTNNGNTIASTQLGYDFSGGNNKRNISAIAFSPVSNTTMYVLTNDGEFFTSVNNGNTWSQSTSTGPAAQYFYGSAILPSAKDQNLIWIGGSGYSNAGVYQSTDNGRTFTAMSTGLPNTLVTSLAATDDEKYLFAATDVGPYIYSFADARWYPMENGHAPDMVYWSVEYIPSLKTARFGTYGRGIWDFTIGSSLIARNYAITSPKAGDVIIAGTSDYMIKFTSQNPGTQRTFQYSSDAGTSWMNISGTEGNGTFTWDQVPNVPTIHGMIRITDEFGTTAITGVFTVKKGSFIITAPKAGESIVGGTSNYLIQYTSQIAGKDVKFEFSSDGGSTWPQVIGTDSSNATSYSWLQVPNIATGKGMIRISDELGAYGISGQFTIVKKTGSSLSHVVVQGVTNNHIATGTQSTITWSSTGNLGTYLAAEYSPDDSAWTLISNTIHPTEFSIPWVIPAPVPAMYVRVRSIDSTSLSSVFGPFIIDQVAGVSSENGGRLQIINCPNPFSSVTTFKYTIPERGLVTISVFDILGHEVASILSATQEKGTYSAAFEASRLPSGSYTYVLACGSRKIAGQMTIER